ncbi:MAG TPA: C40 family peptidase [Gemmatimonadaceae bacterium]|nr:C40 family peptidase [Gemmatimonadaceae bacterium]
MSAHLPLRPAALLIPALVVSGCSTPASVIRTGRTLPSVSAGAAVVIPTAERYIGVPYRWGGTSPSTGFDCSGYTQYVFAKHGVRLPRTSRSQAFAGANIRDYRALRPGDLIMFAEDGKPISHVAIYAGHDRIIHSSSSGAGVRYDDLTSRRGTWFRTHMVVARRVATPAQGSHLVFDLVSQLRSAGVRVDAPSIADVIGDLAPR